MLEHVHLLAGGPAARLVGSYQLRMVLGRSDYQRSFFATGRTERSGRVQETEVIGPGAHADSPRPQAGPGLGPERSEGRMTSPMPFDELEARAAEQRRQLHNTVTELRQTVRE